MREAKLCPQILAAMVMSIGAYAHGSTLGWTSNITDRLRDGELNGLEMARAELGWTGSCLTLGAMICCLCIGFLADSKGRKVACLITVIPFAFGWLLILLAVDIHMVYVGRFLTGIGGGAFNVVAPIYTSEIAEIDIRGSLGIMTQLFTGLGVLHSNLLGWALPLLYFNIVCLSLPLLFGVLFCFQPETPLWYFKKGRHENTQESFRRLRGKKYNFNVEMKYLNYELSRSPSSQSVKDFVSVLRTRSQQKAALICFVLMFFQQFSGINAIVFYTKEIFIHSTTPISPHLAVVITGSVGFLGCALSVWLIDRVGRTILLNTSSVLCSIASFLLGLFFTVQTKLDDEDILKFAYFLPITGLLLFVFSFNLGLGPIPWLTCSELLAAPIRAKLSSIAGAFNWLLAFLITRFYLTVSANIGIDHTFYIFSSMSTLCFFFVVLIVPETKDKQFVDILMDLEVFFNL